MLIFPAPGIGFYKGSIDSVCAPSGHFVLQVEAAHGQQREGRAPLTQSRALPERALRTGPPAFYLAGLAVGNGLTDPRTQARGFSAAERSMEKWIVTVYRLPPLLLPSSSHMLRARRCCSTRTWPTSLA